MKDGRRPSELGLPSVADLLAQGPSFQFVDRLISVGEEFVVAELEVVPDSSILRDHFPEDPLYPGVLMIEAMAQTASLIPRIERFLDTNTIPPRRGALGKVRSAAFYRPARPGDTLVLLATRGGMFGNLAEYSCTVCVEGTCIATSSLVLAYS